jgi:hypothetical protein
MDHERWLNDLLVTVAELKQFAQATHIPAPVPHLMLGSVIEDTCFALAIPIRYLVELRNQLPISDPMLQADIDNSIRIRVNLVHRVFFVGVYTAIEAGLRYICESASWEIEPQSKKRMRGIVRCIHKKIDATPIEKELRDLEKLAQQYPAFQDFLEEIIRRKELPEDFCQTARTYRYLLSIFRNKCSHSGDAKLTPHEVKSLRDAKWTRFVTPDGQLSFDLRTYPGICLYLLSFLRTVYAAPNKPIELADS